MPGLYKDEGIVLKTIKLGEADRIVTMFTHDNGKVRAVAKGIRKTRSRFGGRLEPFTRVSLVVHKGRNLDTITSADILESFKVVRDELGRLSAAASLVEIVDKISPERERSVSVYGLLHAGLEAVAAYGATTVVPAFVVKLLSLSGYHPQLGACAGCGRAEGLVAFSPALGGAACDSCWVDDGDALRLSVDRLRLLADLLVSEFGLRADTESTVELTQALRCYAEYHLERPLRSLRAHAAS
jgi:DNA repair protein RecO (recombination protein O)